MLGVHKMCNRGYQRKEGILKPEKLRIYGPMYRIHDAKCLRGFCEELKALEGTLLEGGQEDGRSRYG